MKKKKSVLKNPRGQSLIEYVILVAIVGIGTMGMVRLLQKSVSVNIAKVIHTLQDDHGARPTHERINARDLRKASFADFMNGTGSQSRDQDSP